ncbi:murein L,D-transpeptidase [Naumannella sp. ID2617S]|nr:murein L,D-transpeptidase [Naumannella sp. ID2617S]
MSVRSPWRVSAALCTLALAALPLAGCAKPGTGDLTAAPAAQAPAEEQPAPVPAPEPTATETPTAPGGQPTAEPTPPPPSSAPTAAPTPRASSAPTAARTAGATRTPGGRPTTSPSGPAKPQAGPAILSRGSSGDSVRDLQARLKQAGWFREQVTGFYGPTTASAVSGFQVKRGLPVTGSVDRATLNSLQQMTRTPTAEEKADAQKPAATPSASATQAGGVPAGVDPRCMTGRALCISKKQNKLRWMVNGQVQTTLAVRFGTKELPTREGSFSVQWKSRDHVSSIYHTPMPYALFFSGGQAVHYSPDFAARGYSGGSHGCVNVRDKAAMASLFNTVSVGDKVIVY